jgi:hypothetical protein
MDTTRKQSFLAAAMSALAMVSCQRENKTVKKHLVFLDDSEYQVGIFRLVRNHSFVMIHAVQYTNY